MQFALKIFCTGANGHVHNSQPIVQYLENILEKYTITCVEAFRGDCSKRASLTGKSFFRMQKTNFPVW